MLTVAFSVSFSPGRNDVFVGVASVSDVGVSVIVTDACSDSPAR